MKQSLLHLWFYQWYLNTHNILHNLFFLKSVSYLVLKNAKSLHVLIMPGNPLLAFQFAMDKSISLQIVVMLMMMLQASWMIRNTDIKWMIECRSSWHINGHFHCVSYTIGTVSPTQILPSLVGYVDSNKLQIFTCTQLSLSKLSYKLYN